MHQEQPFVATDDHSGEKGPEEAGPAISREVFDSYFRNDIPLDHGGEILNYIDMSPEKDRVPGEPPVVFVGGFNTAKESYYLELLNLVRSGRRVIFVNPETHVPPISEWDGAYTDIPEIIRGEVEALEHVIKDAHLPVSTVNIVGHSRGADIAAIYAARHSGSVGQLVLDSPIGLAGKKNTTGLLFRSFREFYEEHKKAKINREQAQTIEKEQTEYNIPTDDFIARMGEDFEWKIEKEVPAIAATDIVPVLKNIQSRKSDEKNASQFPRITIVNANADKILTPDVVERAVGNNLVALADRWVNYPHKGDAHGKRGESRPEAGLHRQIMDNDPVISGRPTHLCVDILNDPLNGPE